MSESFGHLVRGMIESIRLHVLPNLEDDFARGQIFAILFSLESLKQNADWKIAPLLQQVRIQDEALADVLRLAEGVELPTFSALPRIAIEVVDSVHLELLRDQGDRHIGRLLACLPEQEGIDPESAKLIERRLRKAQCDQLKVELDVTPKSMFEDISTGGERAGA
jgi:hypothetical protein